MPNTVNGPYTPTSWVNGTTPVNATNMNHLETQGSIALHGWNPDLFTPFILSGMVSTKDGTAANQLDVTSGKAYIQMTDGTIGLIITIASTPGQFITSAATSTYHLYLQPDGTWYWNTANTPQANSLAICTLTTDGSGNISVVTDARTLTTTLLGSMAGSLLLTTPHLSTLYSDGGAITSNGSGTITATGLVGALFGAGGGGLSAGMSVQVDTVNHATNIMPASVAGNAQPLAFHSWDGTTMRLPFTIGSTGYKGPANVDDSGNITGVNIYGNIGGGPLQASGSSTSTSSSDVVVASVTVPVAGVYLVWMSLSGTVLDNTFAPSMTMTGYQNTTSLAGTQGNALAAAQATSANTFGATLAWCYKVTCAASDVLHLEFHCTSTSTSVFGQIVAQYLHS